MMNREQIKELALANGFKLKQQTDGSEDLNPYVYEFVQALVEPLQSGIAALNSEISMRKDQVVGAARVIQEEKDDNARLRAEIKRLQAINRNLYQEAVIHAQEARTQRSTVHDIYQALGIQKGDWNGKVPVVEKFAEVEQERDQLKEIQFVSQCEEVDVIRCLKTLAYEHNHADVPRYQALAKRVMDKYVERGAAAKASLVAHDAEVIERFARELGVFDPEYDDQEYIEVPRYTIKEYASQLRQQAKEWQS